MTTAAHAATGERRCRTRVLPLLFFLATVTLTAVGSSVIAFSTSWPAANNCHDRRWHHRRHGGSATQHRHRPPVQDGASSFSSFFSIRSKPSSSRRPPSPLVQPLNLFKSKAAITSQSQQPPPRPSTTSLSSSSIISPCDDWGNVATLSFAASLAQLLGKTTMAGRLLGAPVTAMALTFVLSSVSWIPRCSLLSSSSSSASGWKTLLPPGGSSANTFLQGVSLTLATPLLLLGTSVRGSALRRCGPLLGSFVVASLGTLAGATLAFSVPLLNIRAAMMASLPGRDGAKIAAALLAKNIGGGINYVAVCSCLNASPEAVAAGLCVDNVMALLYFPLVSVLASKYGDVEDDDDVDDEDECVDEVKDIVEDDGSIINNGSSDSTSPIEALSHAFTLAVVLTASGRFLNSKLRHLPALLGKGSDAGSLNLSLPITTLLAVLFSTYYPPNIFLSPTSSSSNDNNNNDNNGSGAVNAIAKAGETLGTSLLYLFFATAGAPGWRVKDSVQKSFPSIASFLVILYGVHGGVLWGFRKLVNACTEDDDGDDNNNYDKNNKGNGRRRRRFWNDVASPQRLLAGSSAAIGGPATAAALAGSRKWDSLTTPSLLVGNVGYAVATFIGLLFYGAFRVR